MFCDWSWIFGAESWLILRFEKLELFKSINVKYSTVFLL